MTGVLCLVLAAYYAGWRSGREMLEREMLKQQIEEEERDARRS